MNKMYNPTLKTLILLCGVLVSGSSLLAQVTSGDSLALVSFYHGTNGASWANHTNWLTANVPSWYGVKVKNNRVVSLRLPSNNVAGAADSLVKLDSLKAADLSGNALTSFPALTAHLDTLNLKSNKLTFKDLVPNRAQADSFFFSPQDSTDAFADTTVTEQSSVLLLSNVDRNPVIDDNYEWFKGITSIVSSTSNVYNILCMDSSQVGTYYCRITNTQLPGLALYRRAIVLRVTRLADPGTSFSVCSSNSTLQGIQPAGSTVVWSVVAGGASVTNATQAITAITNLAVGANVFNYSVNANNVSCPANTYSIASVTVTRDTNPSLAYAGVDQSVCSTQSILQGSTPSVGAGTWTVISGTGVVTQPNSPSSAINTLSVGENIIRWQITNGTCAPSFFDEVKIYRDDTISSVSAGSDTSICPASYALSAVLPVNTHGIWSVVSGLGTFSDASSTTSSVSGLSELNNTLRWTVSNTCNTVSADVHVTVYTFIAAHAGADREIFYSPITKHPLGDSIVVTGGSGQYTYVWSPATDIDNAATEHPQFLTPDSGLYTYTVNVSDGHGCTASDDVTLHVVRNNFLTVPTLFTPNDDGVNDEFFIPGIESYPNNELTVVDRNDQVVYKQKAYKNEWKGANERGFSQLGSKLPADTYFYTLKLEDGKALQKGFFLIKY